MEIINRINRIVKSVIERYRTRERHHVLYRESMKIGVVPFYITIFVFLLAIAIYLYFMLSSSGNYLSAWFFWTISAIILLVALSAPRNIDITKKNIEIHGFIDVTQIEISSIEKISVIDKKKYKNYLPLIASYGFLGFFGYFIDIKKMEIVRFYASKYNNLVEIKTKSDQKYIVNIDDSADFINVFNKIINPVDA